MCTKFVFSQLASSAVRYSNSNRYLSTSMASLQKKIINTPEAPAPVGAYSQAVEVNGTLYISGQLGLDATSGNMVDGGVEAQARCALKNMGAILKAAGMTPDNVVKCTILLQSINDFASVNNAYKECKIIFAKYYMDDIGPVHI